MGRDGRALIPPRQGRVAAPQARSGGAESRRRSLFDSPTRRLRRHPPHAWGGMGARLSLPARGGWPRRRRGRVGRNLDAARFLTPPPVGFADTLPMHGEGWARAYPSPPGAGGRAAGADGWGGISTPLAF